MRTRWIGYLCLTLAMIGVGSTVPASRLAGAGLPPFTATALRFLVAFPVFWLLMRRHGLAWPRPGWHDGVLLLIQAGAGSVGYTVLLITGTRLTSAADAGVMLGMLPAMCTLLAGLVLRERQSRADWAGAALASAGVVVVTLHPGGGALSPRMLAGDLLVLGAVACEAVFVLLNKRLRAPLPPLVLSTAMTGLGLAVALVPALLLEQGTRPAGPPGPALAAVGYYALVPTVLGFLLWYAGTARTTGTEAALFTAVAPVSAVLFAALLFGDPLGPRLLLGMALVLAALLLAGTRRRGR